MIRMIREEDIFSCWWWYNWYITHSVTTFETEPVQQSEFSERVKRVRQRFPWIVLQIDDELMGYAYLDSFNTRSAYEWTCDLAIYLNPEARGKGYGKQLMEAIIDLAKKDGYTKMASLITEGNEASIGLHKSFGFEEVGFFDKVGFKNDRWLGVHYMIKTLQDVDNNTKLEKPLNLDPYAVTKKNRVPIE